MKIETKEVEWQPIVVTIETREEAALMYTSLNKGGIYSLPGFDTRSQNSIYNLFLILKDRVY